MNQTIKEIGKKIVGLIPSKPWISYRFKKLAHYKMDWKNPKTFNQKLQWLKLYDRKPIYTTMVDKYGAKKYVADIIGEEYIIPTLGVWDKFSDIDFDSLPNQFVLKCTHDSGGMCIVRNKSEFDKKQAKKKFKIALNRNPYSVDREWPYKNVKPRIIAEKYMQDGDSKFLPVYKFFCFDGRAKIVQVIQNDKTPDETIDYFDREWNLLELRQNFPNSKMPLKKPECLDKMLEIVDTLAQSKKNFIRVDLYIINGAIYFSEYTFFSDSGTAKFHPSHWDETLGSWITLPTKTKGRGKR